MEIREQIKFVNIALSGTLDVYRIWAKKHKLGEEKRQQLIHSNMEYYELLKQEIEHG